MVWPWAGPRARVFRTSRSSVPWRISPWRAALPFFGMGPSIPLDHLPKRAAESHDVPVSSIQFREDDLRRRGPVQLVRVPEDLGVEDGGAEVAEPGLGPHQDVRAHHGDDGQVGGHEL